MSMSGRGGLRPIGTPGAGQGAGGKLLVLLTEIPRSEKTSVDSRFFCGNQRSLTISTNSEKVIILVPL